MGDKRARIHLTQPNAKDLDFLRELVEEERIGPVIEKTYSLDQIVEAHRHLERGHAKGKIVIEIQKR